MIGPSFVRIVNLLREPLFKMSNTGFQVCDLTLVPCVLASGSKPNVTRLIPFVVIGPVHLPRWIIPSGQGLDIDKEASVVLAPLGPYSDAPLPVVFVDPVLGVVAPIDSGAKSVEQP